MTSDEQYMQRALDLAEKGVGRTSPNPAVGAVIVKDGQIVGEGYHQRAGTPHAEIHALNQAGIKARGATVYVTLEPCCHYGKTGPCSQALIKAGVKRVVVATTDPNPKVAGGGIRELKDAGIEVTVGILEEKARELNQPFFKRIATGLPYVTLKTAMTMDGKMAAVSGDARWVTGEEARQLVHELRNRFDVVMVGAGTVIKDDPQLNVRLSGTDTRDPVRAVIDGRLDIPLDSRIVKTAREQRTIIFSSQNADKGKMRMLGDLGVEVIPVGGGPSDLDLKEVLRCISEMGLSSVLVEGGGYLNWCLVSRGLVDYWYNFIAPKAVGGKEAVSPVDGEGFYRMADALPVIINRVVSIGQDWLLEGWVGEKKRW